MFFFAYVVQYGWGIGNLFLSFTLQDLDPTLPGAADVGTYIVVYLIVIPFITSIATCILKWIDDKGKISPFFMIQLIISIIQGIAMIIIAYVFMTFVQGVVVSGVMVIFVYVAFMFWIYSKNDFYLPKPYAIVNIVVGSCAVVAPAIVSLCVE